MELSNEDLKAISDLLQPIRDDLQDVKQKVSGLEKDITVVKSDLKQLQKDANFILDEVERVHGILDTHTSHTKNRHIIGSYATLGI